MLGRLRRILESAIRDLVEKSGDPELELGEFVGEVELGLGEVRAQLEESGSRRDVLASRAAENERAAAEWMGRAERAAGRDEDELAKEALRLYHEAAVEAESAAERVAEAELEIATLRRDEAELEKKLTEVRLEQRRLSAKLRRAEAERRGGAAVTEGDIQPRSAEVMRERIAEEESVGEAAREVHGESIEAQFAELERGPSLDEELAELKKRVKSKQPGA